MPELKEKKIKALTLSHKVVLFVSMFSCKNLKTQIASNTMYKKWYPLPPLYTENSFNLSFTVCIVSFLCLFHFNKYGDSTSGT